MTDLFLRPLFTWRSAVASPFGPENPTTRHVLLTLALHMNEKGESCFPSIELLVEESGLSRRAVIEHLRLAAESGWIGKRERRERNGQGWRRIEYVPLIPNGVDESVKEWDEERRARRAPRNDSFHGKQGGAPDAPAKQGAPTAPRQGGARRSKGGAPDDVNVVHDVHTSTSSSTTVNRRGGGGATPTPVAACFKAYAEGIKSRYGAEYPPSAKANGQLSQVVARVGRDAAVAVTQFYMASSNPWYVKVRHSLDYLLRDCERLWMDVQIANGGGAVKPATHARVALLNAEGKVICDLGEQTLGGPEEVAKRVMRDYASRIARIQPRYIEVRLGAERRVFSVEELKKEPVPA